MSLETLLNTLDVPVSANWSQFESALIELHDLTLDAEDEPVFGGPVVTTKLLDEVIG